MDELKVGTWKLHVGTQVDEEVIQGSVSTQTAVHYRPLCAPGEVLIRRDTFTSDYDQTITKYYHEPPGHLVYDPKEIGDLARYEEFRKYHPRRPVGFALERCEDCLNLFDEKYILLVLSETEL